MTRCRWCRVVRGRRAEPWDEAPARHHDVCAVLYRLLRARFPTWVGWTREIR